MTASTATRTISGLKIHPNGQIETVELTADDTGMLRAMYPHLGNTVAEVLDVQASAPTSAWMDEEGRFRTPDQPNLMASTIIAEINQTATPEQLQNGPLFFALRPDMLHFGTILLFGESYNDDSEPVIDSLDPSVLDQIKALGHTF
ncbi:hypothetical protein [Gordonia sihwensis]|uniref:hypothetical protein n=1 Tax=Gordonia sihwensis TaxID=173559 RepID=UPI0005ED916F|nr:hypothetical protein [Gordonia sihwensis]KJR10290.1 hypothetical protein UG54_01560 [Gordonia sihwensis]